MLPVLFLLLSVTFAKDVTSPTPPQDLILASQQFFLNVCQRSKSHIVILDFWAPWCGPCQNFGKVLDTILTKHKNILPIKVNVDQFRAFSKHIGVRSIPDIRIYVGGKLAKHIQGSLSEEDLEEYIREFSSEICHFQKRPSHR